MKRVINIFILICMVHMVQAAGPGYNELNFVMPSDGADSMKCLENLSTMSEFVKINLYEYALDSWRYMFNECPASSKNTYIYGSRIMKYFIEKEKDPNKQKAYVDTLMMIYDRRIKYYGEEGDLLGRKGIDLIRYNKDAAEESYGYLKKSIELTKKDAEEAILITCMQLSAVVNKMNIITTQQVVDDYIQIMNIIEAKQGDDKTQKAAEAIEQIFASTGAADCETIVSIFAPKYESGSNDPAFLKKILSLMEQGKCEDSELYVKSSEKLFELEPTSSSATYMAKLFAKKTDYEKAEFYYKKAIELENDSDKLGQIYYELAVLNSIINKPGESRKYALNAIAMKPKWGQPYILIGNLYAASANSCGSNEFEQKAIYWVIVDKYIQAKNADPSVAGEANELISRYSPYFPNKENAFFYGYGEGDTFKVGCWINENTKVRF